ncbi:hypothetical protein NDU88_003720 [Pleurodeles waltl]|uniref:Uncharacterized protein n=1 Tax=Pleurodeles waltl TaxID=8319 RepID=A0AAV7V0T8_PLEWA|nr:hypothetical protein NDU88_003720 [Pleurodeles waltl]
MDIPQSIQRLIAIGLLLAKRYIPMRCDRVPVPTIEEWYRDMVYCNTQTDTYNELISPTSRPAQYWDIYKHCLIGKETGEPKGE